MAMEDARGPLCVRRITGSGGGITYFFGHWQGCSRWSSPCCVSQHRSSYIYGRKKESLSEPQSQWRACCDASHTAFLTHSSERHWSPREEPLGASPSL